MVLLFLPILMPHQKYQRTARPCWTRTRDACCQISFSVASEHSQKPRGAVEEEDGVSQQVRITSAVPSLSWSAVLRSHFIAPPTILRGSIIRCASKCDHTKFTWKISALRVFSRGINFTTNFRWLSYEKEISLIRERRSRVMMSSLRCTGIASSISP